MSDDSVRRTVEKLEADRKWAEAQKHKSAHEEEIKKAQAPGKWQELAQRMKRHCELCNAEAGQNHLEFKPAEGKEFNVVRNPPRAYTLNVVFNPQVYTITYHIEISSGLARIIDKKLGGKRDGTFFPKVDGEKLCYTLDGKKMDGARMGDTLIQALLD